MSSAIGSIDWRVVLAVLGILAALLLLIAWNTRQDVTRGAKWLSHSALSLELLGLALSVFWAVTAPDGAILPVIFAAGWIGMLIGRAVLISHTVNAWQQRRFGVVTGAILALIIAYAALYGSGLFHAVNDAGLSAQARLEASKPALALDAQIEAAQVKLDGLSGYADKAQATRDYEKHNAESTAQAARRTELSGMIASKRAELAVCKPDHLTRCIRPLQGEIAALESQLSTLGNVTGGDYAQNHAAYLGAKQHLADLHAQRSELSGAGAGVQEAWLPEDRLLSWLFGITPEAASRIKWLVFTGIFDVLSLLFRIFAALQLGRGDAETTQRRRLEALLSGGFSVQEAAMLAGAGELRPAQVEKNGAIPALDTGGRILGDGLAHVHAGERVLNAQETAAYEALNDKPLNGKPLNGKPLNGKPLNGKPLGKTLRACKHCGNDFYVTRRDRFYCGDECRESAWENRTGAKLRKVKRK